MMALANLLHHPVIRPETMSGDHFRGRTIKRSNKDLGRVLALAYLARERDLRDARDELGEWHTHMAAALREFFPHKAHELASVAGNGLRALLDSQGDLEEAITTCSLGLLASMEVGSEALRATGRRVLAEVIEPLQEAM
jgi:hypothetical protein